MILLPLLFLVSATLMGVSIIYLNQSIKSYYDFVAFVMVIGGTLIVGLSLLPWEYRKDLKRVFGFLFRKEKRHYKKALQELTSTLSQGRVPTDLGNQFLYQRILAEGVELINLGFPKEKLQEVLTERVYHTIKRWKKIAASMRSLAKYPPAFGLMGTVFGLVNIMKHLADSSDPGKLGVEMAIALVATMYGLLIANFVVNPMGEIANKKAEEEEEYALLALETVMMMKDQTPLLEAVEMLNSYVPEEQRQGFSDFASGEEAA
jgi:chemotaxis protein MotA